MRLYEFPYDKVPQGAKVIIYGAGEVGQTYLYQIIKTKYCKLECFLDKDNLKYKDLAVDVYHPDDITRKKYDLIVVANNSEEIAREIIDDLVEKYNIDRSCIIYENKLIEPVDVIRDDELHISEECFAYNRDGKYSVSIYISGGFGDYIIRKENVREVSMWDKNILIDIYVGKGKENFTKILFNDIDNVNLIVGSDIRYKNNKKKYVASLCFSAFLIIDYLDESHMDNVPQQLRDKLKMLQVEFSKYGLKELGILFSLHYARCKKDGLNCYTAYNRYGVFNVKKESTTIPLIDKFKKNFYNLGLSNYITLNYGWDRNLKTKNPPAKVWPFEYYADLVKLVKQRFPQIKIVQIGMDDSSEIVGCDHYVFGKSMELIKYILKNSCLHIDCEGGLVHMATQLGTKCAVLFGPTPVDYYGYESNINIVSVTCSDCYWYVADCFSCYKGMESSECMRSILPENIMENITDDLLDIIKAAE